MLRYLRELADRDFALDQGMIPLGSCTMKLNATTEMEPVGLPGFADIHPFAPADTTPGYRSLIEELEQWLADVTGYAKVSVQPNAGSQGELAGPDGDPRLPPGAQRAATRRLPHPVERPRHECRVGRHGRDAGRRGGEQGRRDGRPRRPPRRSVEEHADALAAIMVTYPSTHGVYEEGIVDMCALVHEYGGQVYIDGANLNALLGLAKPGQFGGDVSHLNLHKTFCIPHGGGGPGVGPVAVADASGAVPALTSHAPGRRPIVSGIGPVERGAVRQRRHPCHQLGLHPAALRRRPGARDEVGRVGGQLRRRSTGALVPRALHRASTASWRTSASWTCGP